MRHLLKDRITLETSKRTCPLVPNNLQTTMPHLPLELFDIVFGFLHAQYWEDSWNEPFHGKEALHYCSLVSRDWNALAKPHLFHDVVYSFRGQPPTQIIPEYRWKYEFFCSSRPNLRFKTLGMFIEFLEQSSVRKYIYRLRLDVWPLPVRPHINEMYRILLRRDKIDPDLLVRLLTLLPRLSTLHLINVWPLLPLPPPPPHSELEKSLRCLRITFYAESHYRIRYFPPSSRLGNMPNLLNYFPGIRRLELARHQDRLFEDTNRSTSIDSCQMYALESLAVFKCQSSPSRGAAFRFLSQSAAACAIRSLSVDVKTLDNAAGREYFRTVAPQLESLDYTINDEVLVGKFPSYRFLRLEMSIEISLTDADPVLDVFVCPNLRDLRVNATLTPADLESQCRYMVNLFSLVGSSDRTVVFNLRCFTLRIGLSLADGTAQWSSNWMQDHQNSLKDLDNALGVWLDRCQPHEILLEHAAHSTDNDRQALCMIEVFPCLNGTLPMRIRPAQPTIWQVLSHSVVMLASQY